MLDTPDYSFWQFFKDTATYIKPYRARFLFGIFLRFSSDLMGLYPAIALTQTVRILTTGQDLSALVWVLGTWGVAVLYYGFTHSLAKYFGYRVAEAAALDLFRNSLAHVFSLDLSWQEGENSGNKMKRIDRGRDGMDAMIRLVFDVLIEVFVRTVGIVLIFANLDLRISASLIFFIVTYYIIGTFMLKKAIAQEKVVSEQYEALGGTTFESLNNMQTIKALAIDGGIMKTVSTQIKKLLAAIYRRIFLYRLRSGVLSLFELSFEFTVIGVIVWGVVTGRWELGLLVLFTSLFFQVAESTRELTDATQQILLYRIWLSRTMAILNTQPTVENPARLLTQQEYPENWQELRLDHLQFTYKKAHALKDISFSIKRGEKVGIVGLSGAGKSTLFKLLLDLYETYEGSISLDNVEFKNMRRQSYVDHVAVVLQDTELFNLSLKENITIAAKSNDRFSQARLKEVLTMSHLDEVVANLPQGIETLVGEKGFKLSGGQRQRVGIARALYRQPDILLLDEATSHLDGHSEKMIQQALHECMHQFTTIVIAHRLSTIKEMDRIVVLERGLVIESGSFAELVKKDGAFARMWREQKL